MFTIEDLHARARQQPFVPFRIVTSAGQAYDIYHPDLVMVGERELMVGTASTQHPRVYSRASRLAIVHITALEDLPVASPPQTNGEP
jgi:hypothetical protein